MNAPVKDIKAAVTTGALPASRKVFATPAERARPPRAAARDRPDRRRSGEPNAAGLRHLRPLHRSQRRRSTWRRRPRRAIRLAWVTERGGVEAYEGRDHQAGGQRQCRRISRSPSAFTASPHRPLRGLDDAHKITQLRIRPRRHRHQGDDLRRRARESRPQAAMLEQCRGERWRTARASAPRCPPSSPPTSSATRSPAAAPSFPANINHAELEPMIIGRNFLDQDQRQYRQLRRLILRRRKKRSTSWSGRSAGAPTR
jgi:phosphomethylpyrimidine synthase